MLQRHPLGTVAHLWRYPTKSLAPEALDAVDCDENGLAGDRTRALFVTNRDHARTDKPYRGKEHELLHTRATPAEAVTLGAARGVALALRTDGRFFDLEPVSLVFDTWLREGERLVGRTLEPQRYRPNLYIETHGDFAASEADLVDRILAIGAVRLRVSQPIARCVTTTYDLRTGESDPRVLSAIANERDNTMGIYAHVVNPGHIQRGDAIRIDGA